MAIGSPNFAQNQKNNIQKELVQWLNQNNSEHNTIINMKIENIFKIYGQKKWLEIIRKHMLIEINKLRSKSESSDMEIDKILNKIAQEHAQDMVENDYLDHVDSQWRHIWDRAKDNEYKYYSISENIANDDNIREVISGFVNSKIWWHEEILSNEYENIWFGIAIDAGGNAYFVLNFAKPFK